MGPAVRFWQVPLGEQVPMNSSLILNCLHPASRMRGAWNLTTKKMKDYLQK